MGDADEDTLAFEYSPYFLDVLLAVLWASVVTLKKLGKTVFEWISYANGIK
jgi:hypothetical protein